MATYSISQLAKQFGLSRSTLLHYDAIGLLQSTSRTKSNYRIYTQTEYDRLQKICTLRSTGISLKKIKSLLLEDEHSTRDHLITRMNTINVEIGQLREQQKIIIDIIGSSELSRSTRFMTKEKWVSILRSAGLDEKGMNQWHAEYERTAPEGHQDFLESLGLDNAEIEKIRNESKEA